MDGELVVQRQELEVVKGDDAFLKRVWGMVAEGKGLHEVAKVEGLDLCAGAFARWYAREHEEEFRAAREVHAHRMVVEAVRVAEGSGDARLEVETKLKVAAKYNRREYGEEREVVPVMPVLIQVGDLRGRAVEEKGDAEQE